MTLIRKEMVKKRPSASQETYVQRPRNTELVIDARVAQWFVRATTVIWGLFGAGMGLAILFGGEGRFSGISYEVAAATPGAPQSWAVTILVAGVCMLLGAMLGRPRLTAFGGLVGCFWGLLFSATFLLSAIRHPEANNTAFAAYFAIGIMFAMSGVVNLLMAPPKWAVRLFRRIT